MALLITSPHLKSLVPCLVESDATAATLSDILLRSTAKASIFLEQTQSAPSVFDLPCLSKPDISHWRLDRIPIIFTNGRLWQFGIANRVERTVNVPSGRVFDVTSASNEEFEEMILLQYLWVSQISSHMLKL